MITKEYMDMWTHSRLLMFGEEKKREQLLIIKTVSSQALVAYVCNPSYLGG
jgi:hypothetical protein